jgi:hypothetical protein
MEAQSDEEKRKYRNEYMKKYRETHDRALSDWITRQSPERKERDKLRKRLKYKREKEFRQFQEAMPIVLAF